MANKERKMAVTELGPDPSDDDVDSQLVITLRKGQMVPECLCTKAGRMTGQMVMGNEGAGIMRLDVELRRAQLALRRQTPGAIPPANPLTLEQRVMQTTENTNV